MARAAHREPAPCARRAHRRRGARFVRRCNGPARNDDAGETRTVDVHVHWLRSTLEDDASAPKFIHTVRGVGYVFRRRPETARV
jgi:DNA-binding response OmpR family regulator